MTADESEEVLQLKTDDEQVCEKLENFNVEILSVIKEAQSQHGLRHGNYQRYREYCTRRLKRLRKVLKFKMGDKRKVTPKKITEDIFNDSRFVMLLVMMSERAWSTAMELKQDAQDESKSSEGKPRKRHHMIERLRKAVQHANRLNHLCEIHPRVNARTKLESQAYCSYINGVLMFELEKWSEARINFQKTQTIYSKLSETLSKQDQQVYLGMVTEIMPNVRYCAYTIGDETAMVDLVHLHGTGFKDPLLADKLDSLVADSRKKQASSMSELVWRNRTVRVKNNKVRLFLIGIKEFDDELSKTEDLEAKIELYDNVLSECKDVLQVTKEDVKADPHSKTSEVSDLQYLHTYLSQIRLTKTIQRNLLLIEDLQAKLDSKNLESAGDAPKQISSKKTARPADFIRLYDIILQNLTEIVNLPGLEDDVEMKAEINVQMLVFKSFRCFHAAKSKSNEKCWTEALALFERVLTRARSAIDAFQVLPSSSKHVVDIESLEKLVETIAFNQYRVHAAAVLTTTDTNDEVSSSSDLKTPLMKRLNTYDEKIGLVYQSSGKNASEVPPITESFPPQFQPVPYKPVFFDLAYNQIEFPNLDSKLRPTQKKAGISGLLSNLWGWGK